MLTFFRRIRKGLLEGGSTSKYLLYAIGEIALVVIGILIALQINNWNESKKDKLKEREFLNRLKDDLEFDLATFKEDINYLETVYQSGLNSLTFLNGISNCKSDCIQELVWLYNASQWTLIKARETTFNEMSQSGFPSNRQLKDGITQYHNHFLLVKGISKPSEYRQFIRSNIQPEIQKILFKTCHPTASVRFAKVIEDCKPQIGEARSREVVNQLKSHSKTATHLTYWMSTIITMIDAIQTNMIEAENILKLIRGELGES